MALLEDLNLNRHYLMSMMMTDRLASMELFHRLTQGDLASGPKSVNRGFHLPWRRTSMIRIGTVWELHVEYPRSHELTQMNL
jgi:hypothetical protein